ncbi:MAG: 50S ribosomal protein L29 [Archaeoglobaceae archaeon]|uniref:Large ribosomal subunit protein uL29 n=1 Tax=Archaeoglobus fulgidus TaxID=2234 RepID=A0A7J3M2V5_ARCFL
MKREERLKKLRELEMELLKLRTLVRSGGAVKNPGRIRQIRRDIAKLKTALCEEGWRI